MTHEEYQKRFEEILNNMFTTTRAKNSDYTNADNAFSNFARITEISRNHISVQQSIFVRMTDKWERLCNLMFPIRERLVETETITDTILDLAVYAIILKISIESRQGINEERLNAAPDTTRTVLSRDPDTSRLHIGTRVRD